MFKHKLFKSKKRDVVGEIIISGIFLLPTAPFIAYLSLFISLLFVKIITQSIS